MQQDLQNPAVEELTKFWFNKFHYKLSSRPIPLGCSLSSVILQNLSTLDSIHSRPFSSQTSILIWASSGVLQLFEYLKLKTVVPLLVSELKERGFLPEFIPLDFLSG